MNALFITGTDTGVGKTTVTGLLARFFTEKGLKTITQKWVQTGCGEIAEDIIQHMKFLPDEQKHIEKYYTDMAPYVFKFPSSPHLAALREKKQIDAKKIKKSFNRLKANFDFVIIEGAGGVLVPIDSKKLLIDIAQDLNLPVLVIAANRLGAINHTLLTVEALRKRNLKIAGIIFNRLREEGDELILKDNMKIVEKLSGVKVLGELPCSKNAEVLYEQFLPTGEKLLLFVIPVSCHSRASGNL